MVKEDVVIGVTWLLFAIDLVLVIGRICVRKLHLKKSLAVSDYIILLALAINCVKCCFDTWLASMAPHGKAWDSRFEGQIEAAIDEQVISTTTKRMKIATVASYLYIFNVWAVKASFLAFYYVFAKRLSLTVKYILHFTAFTIGTTFLINVFFNSFYCASSKNPVSIRIGLCLACINTNVFITLTATNIATDVLLMFIPFLLLYAANMRHCAHLMAFSFVLVIGSFTVISAAVRFAILFHKTDRYAPNNFGIEGGSFPLWSQIDTAAGLAAACLPAFRVYLREKKNSRSGTNMGSAKDIRRRTLGRDQDFVSWPVGMSHATESTSRLEPDIELQTSKFEK